MSGRRTQNPSPLAGEDAARSAAGEGRGDAAVLKRPGSRGPSPGRSLRSQPASPARGEGKIADAPRDRDLVAYARSLRARMTNAERKLWYALRDRRFAGFKFRRQVPIGPFIADFVCFSERLVIEVDGGQHAESRRDKRRDYWFKTNNFRVLRLWNNEVLSNLEGVMTVLASELKVEWS
jgi:very-short-patch-repair endonuclease